MSRLQEKIKIWGRMSHWALCLPVLCLFSVPIQAAPIGDRVELHGFGNWSFGDTDGNDYLLGTEDGSYDHIGFALNTIANVTENLTVSSQVHWSHFGEEDEVELDFAFASWKFSDGLRFQIGRIQQPLGIYSQIYDVGTLRPTTFLPQSVYGPAGMVAEGFRGLSFSGNHRGNWGVSWNVYTGEVGLEVAQSFALLAEGARSDIEALTARFVEAQAGEFRDSEEDLAIADTLGFRFELQAPIEGLSFGVSAYAGRPKSEDEVGDAGELEESSWGDHLVVGAHLRYQSRNWSIATEYFKRDEDEFTIDSSYLEVAYRFTEEWQAFGRLDYTDLDFEPLGFTIPQGTTTLSEHQDLTVGVGYWFDANFVLRAELHFVEGNLFAHNNKTLILDSAAGTLEADTTLFQFGASFSF